MTDHGASAQPRSTLRPRRSLLFLLAYIIALSASLLFEKAFHPASDVAPHSTRVHAFDRSGQRRDEVTIAYSEFIETKTPNPIPIILLHGSPGRGSELSRIAKPLAAAGYRVITPDLPGFGDSTHNPPSMSILAHAHEVLALMDQLHIQRAHVLGWSLGGGVAMHMADLAPDRIASLTLLASVSDQESEGTRSYFAEHVKYAMGYAAATVARYTIPHFGLLSHLDDIRASMLNFWDTDMRPLQGLMRRLQTPTLIIHGLHDPLVPHWAAEHSHQLIEPSTLIMTRHQHFFPMVQAQSDMVAAHLLPFLARHNTPGTPALRQYANLAPDQHRILGWPGRWLELQVRQASWITLTLAAALLLMIRLRTGAILLFIAVYFAIIDNGIALNALIVAQVIASAAAYFRGRRIRTSTIGEGIFTRTTADWREHLSRHPIRTALASRFVPDAQETAIEALARAKPRRMSAAFFVLGTLASWPLFVFFYAVVSTAAAFFVLQPIIDALGIAGLFLGLACTLLLTRTLELLLTTTGRHLLRIRFTRLTHREYWPSELLYWPTAPYFVYLGLKHKPIAFTACNPGIESGGGLIGESKQAILDAMPDAAPWILPSVRIDSEPSGASRRSISPDARTTQALAAIASNPKLNFPVILKPDSGYRGHAVKLARSESDIHSYFQSMRSPAILQQYHPGPRECGILWARNPRDLRGPGFIFSITRKEFPILIGDGRHTFEQLIFRHKRFHAQAGVFLSRFADQRTRILSKGESLRLAQSGNHCQGTLFLDGADLITSELTAAIDSIAQGFRGGLDIGRFDIRYESDEILRQGKGFAVLELNGITGESTNIYDPTRSIWWAYTTHFRQWKLMYELGVTRIAQGHKPMAVSEVFRRIRAHKDGRSGPALSD